MVRWQLKQYRTVYKDFYESCTEDTRRSIVQRLSRLWEKGNEAGEPTSKLLEDGIYECRAKNARMLYYFEAGQLIVVVVCFLKKQSKVDRKFIRSAKKIREIIKAGREQVSGLHVNH